MTQMIGALLLAGGSVLLGFCAVQKLKDRVSELQQLSIALELMVRELDYQLTPLPELLRQAANQTKGSVSRFFDRCEQGTVQLQGRTFQAVWQQTLEVSQLRLKKLDLEVLEQLGHVLGRYDAESQKQAIQIARSRLEEQLDSASEQFRRLGKVYSVLGITAGIFLLIVLM